MSAQLKSASLAVGVFALASVVKFKRDIDPKLYPNLFMSKKLSFTKQLMNLLRISLQKQDVYVLGLHSIFLVLRTWLSLVITKLDGHIVKSLVKGKLDHFLKALGVWCALAVPCSLTNAMIKYLQAKLSMGMRLNITNYALKLYLSDNLAFYKIHLDNHITSADQYLTTDIAKFCDSVTSLYSNLCKPVLDMILFNWQLKQTIGLPGTVSLTLNYVITAQVLKYLSPSFGKLAAQQADLEGKYRNSHSKLITNAEEICFYNGETIELSLLNKAYDKLQHHIHKILRLKMPYNMLEDIFVKYEWSAAALLVCGIPQFTGNVSMADASQQFVIAKRLMLSLGDAGGRIMYAYKDMLETTGYLQRLTQLLQLLHNLDANNTVNNVTYGFDGVSFKNVDIGINKETFVNNLSMDIMPNQHTLITGPNGSGKTSIVRVLRELWPVQGQGQLSRPNKEDMMYIPQRAYLSIGSLRDQIIYPDTYDQMKAKGITDADLQNILDIVHLGYLEAREGGFDTKKDWKDVFSGGEKQRVQISRLFYFKPKYVVLDECSSAVSSDVEGLIYKTLKDNKITLITVSHRPALFKYHSYLLNLVGDGAWRFDTMGTQEEETSIENEMKQLQDKIDNVRVLKERLRQINKELGLRH